MTPEKQTDIRDTAHGRPSREDSVNRPNRQTAAAVERAKQEMEKFSPAVKNVNIVQRG